MPTAALRLKSPPDFRPCDGPALKCINSYNLHRFDLNFAQQPILFWILITKSCMQVYIPGLVTIMQKYSFVWPKYHLDFAQKPVRSYKCNRLVFIYGCTKNVIRDLRFQKYHIWIWHNVSGSGGMLLLTKSKGHKSNAPYSGFPNHFQTKSRLHISIRQSQIHYVKSRWDTLYSWRLHSLKAWNEHHNLMKKKRLKS